jgi:endonuclease III
MSKADVEEFEDEIRVGGFYRNNARVIKAVSKMILEQINGLLDFIYSLSFEDARKALL